MGEKTESKGFRWPEKALHYNETSYKKFFNDGYVSIRQPFMEIEVNKTLDWSIDPYKDKTWRLYFHSLYWVNSILWGCDNDQSNKERNFNYLKGLIVSFSKYLNHQLSLDRPHSDSILDDHSLAYRVSYLSLIYERYLKNILSAVEREMFLKCCKKQANILKEYILNNKWDHSNHRIFQIEGLVDYYIAFSSDNKKTLEFCRRSFESFVKLNISLNDGTTKEHALFYHAFLMGRLKETQYLFEEQDVKFDIDFDFIFKQMNNFLWTVMPLPFLLPAVGDTKHGMVFDKKFVKEFQSDRFENEVVKFVRTGGKLGLPPRNLTCFEEDGYYIFRRGNFVEGELYSLFLEKKYIGPHGHVDGGSFTTFYKGVPVLGDSGGPYKYGNKLRFNYFQTQSAHNTISIGEGERYLSKVISYGRHQYADYVVSQVQFPNKKGRWRRIFFQAFKDLILVVDYVDRQSDKEVITSRYHVAPEFSLASLGNGKALISNEEMSVKANFFNYDLDKANDFRIDEGSNLKGLNNLENLACSGYASLFTSKDTEYENGTLLLNFLRQDVATLTTFEFTNDTLLESSIVGCNGEINVTCRKQNIIINFEFLEEDVKVCINSLENS